MIIILFLILVAILFPGGFRLLIGALAVIWFLSQWGIL